MRSKSACSIVLASICGCASQLRALVIAATCLVPRDLPATDYDKAVLTEQTGDYEQAAEQFEAIAKTDSESFETCLRKAVSLRAALDQYDKVILDIAEAENRLVYQSARTPDGTVWSWLGRKRVHWDVTNSPSLALLLAEAYERQGRTADLVALLRRMVRKRSSARDRHVLVRAHFKLGEIAWRRSCPRQQTDGSCVEVEWVHVPRRDLVRADVEERRGGIRPFAAPPARYCPTFERWVSKPIPRDPRLAKEAQRHFARALELWRSDAWDLATLQRGRFSSTDDSETEDAARFAAAGAAFYRAERLYEDYLRIAPPAQLSLPVSPQAVDEALWNRRLAAFERAFSSYLDRKSKALVDLVGPSVDRRGAYDRVVDFGSAYWELAATARMAQAVIEPALAIYGVETPTETPELDEWGNSKHADRCKSMAWMAGAFEDRGVERLYRCVQVADRYMLSSEWSDLCRAKLGQLRRLDATTPAEIVPEPVIKPWCSGCDGKQPTHSETQ